MSQATIYHNPQQQYDYYAIIPHREEPRVLVLTGWTLPHFTPNEYHFGVVGHINRAMRTRLGVRVTTLRCVYEHKKRPARVYAMDNHTPDWTPPPGAAWLTRDQLDTITFIDPEQRLALEAYFDWLEEDSSLRVPWSRSGWFDSAAAWIRLELERHGFKATGPIEQVRSWVRSCTLRVNTTGGQCYFKAVPEIFTYEPVLTRVLGQLFPGRIPHVLSVDVERAWMLMSDFGGEPLSARHGIERWEDALRFFAHIQVDMTARVSSLVAIGCPDRHVDELVFHIERLFADRAAMQPASGGLTDAEVNELLTYTQDLTDLCYSLIEYDIPLSLEHGDLWAGNIIMTDDHPLYFDWSDSSVTHPFFDMLLFLANVKHSLGDVPDAEERLLTAYLEPWTPYLPMNQLKDAMRLAQPVAALHHALIYHAVILPSIEPRAQWEMAHMLPYYLRLLLHFLREQKT
jgi:aminoglycoside/choline kinase family phosphotransferase